MSVKDFKVEIISDNTAYDFLKQYHYLREFIPSSFEISYGLFDKDDLIGVMVFDWWDYEYYIDFFNLTFCKSIAVRDTLRLQFLACIDDTPKNTESYFLGNVLKRIKKDVVKADTIFSFAGGIGNHPNHKGTIYKASNFTLLHKDVVEDKDGSLRDLYFYIYKLKR